MLFRSLIGKLLSNNLINLGLYDEARDALAAVGMLVLESALMMWQVKLWPVWCSLVVVLIAAINFRDLWSTVQQLLGRGKKKRA